MTNNLQLYKICYKDYVLLFFGHFVSGIALIKFFNSNILVWLNWIKYVNKWKRIFTYTSVHLYSVTTNILSSLFLFSSLFIKLIQLYIIRITFSQLNLGEIFKNWKYFLTYFEKILSKVKNKFVTI